MRTLDMTRPGWHREHYECFCSNCYGSFMGDNTGYCFHEQGKNLVLARCTCGNRTVSTAHSLCRNPVIQAALIEYHIKHSDCLLIFDPVT